MNYKYILLFVLSCSFLTISAQKHITKTGTIEIFSQTPLFTIEGVNKKVASILNTETGEVVASTLIRSFKFEEALVEEHFNENYLEPHKFPKSIFKGKITDYKKIDFSKDGTYSIILEGKLKSSIVIFLSLIIFMMFLFLNFDILMFFVLIGIVFFSKSNVSIKFCNISGLPGLKFSSNSFVISFNPLLSKLFCKLGIDK